MQVRAFERYIPLMISFRTEIDETVHAVSISIIAWWYKEIERKWEPSGQW